MAFLSQVFFYFFDIFLKTILMNHIETYIQILILLSFIVFEFFGT